MEKTKQPPIHSLEELYREMDLVKFRVKERENILRQKITQIPAESAKAIIGAILPMIIGTELSSGVWKLVKSIFSLIKGKKAEGEPAEKGSGWKENLASGAGKLGLATALKLLLGFWKKN